MRKSYVTIKDEDKEQITKQAFDLFEITLPDDFFGMGNLVLEKSTVPIIGDTYCGTDVEKGKHAKYLCFEVFLTKLELLDLYVASFDAMLLLPLAISNTSTVSDDNISVFLEVISDTADVIRPTKDVFNQEIRGCEGLVYEDGIIETLFHMQTTSDIGYDFDISYDEAEERNCREIATVRALHAFPNAVPPPDETDYESELGKYIADPLETSDHLFEFAIDTLRPNETKWLGPAILVYPKQDTISISFSIKSSRSKGDFRGVLESK